MILMVSMLLKTLAVLVAEDFTINLQNIKFLNENRERTKFKLVRVISALSLFGMYTHHKCQRWDSWKVFITTNN